MQHKNQRTGGDDLYRTLSKAIFLAAAVWVLLWFLDLTIAVLLMFALALVVTAALNPPVYWLEQRKVPRAVGAPLVLLTAIGIGGLIGWLVLPEMFKQGQKLFDDLPKLSATLEERSAQWLSQYPELQKHIGQQGVNAQTVLPNVQTTLLRVGRYTVTAIGAIFYMLILLTIVLFALSSPRPLVAGALQATPSNLREGMERALVKGSRGVVAWMWSNVIIGVIEAVLLTTFLHFMDVPGALVWGSLAFFAELIPHIGAYVVAIPVLIVSYAASPTTAIWTLLFLVFLNQFTNIVISPLIRKRTMDIHPVSQIFLVLAFGTAFGVLGAILAMPLAGFIKAIYEEFYASRHAEMSRPEEHAENVLKLELEEDSESKPEA